MRGSKMFLNLLAACGLAMTSTAALADHIPGHENCDPEFPMPIPGQEFWDGNSALLFVTFLGPLEDSVITNTTFDITYVSDGTTPASDLFMEITVQVDEKFREFCLTGADLGFGSGPGMFAGTLETDVLNGVVGVGFLPPNSIVDLVVDVVGGGGIQGSAHFNDSFITFDVVPPPDCCPGDINADGVVDVLDLIDLLLCFGQPAIPGCETADIDGSGTVNVLDLIDLLLAFGQPCL